MPAVSDLGLETFNWNRRCNLRPAMQRGRDPLSHAWPGPDHVLHAPAEEGLHGLGAHCLTYNGSTRCPTIFPAPPTLGATFNRTLLHRAGEVISTEARVYNNYNGTRSYQNRSVDLNVWLPNLNIGRDPRWGRDCETYSEDPIVIGLLGGQIIDGAMHGSDGSSAPYLKMIVAAKHGTAYQVETNRFAFNDIRKCACLWRQPSPSACPLHAFLLLPGVSAVSMHDLTATYLPAWELVASCDVPGQGELGWVGCVAVTRVSSLSPPPLNDDAGCVTGYMCAYDAINSVRPSSSHRRIACLCIR